jgi:hypothetical protein
VFEFGSLWQLDIEPGLYNASMRATLFLAPNDPDVQAASVICGVIDLNTLGRQFPRIYFAETATQIQSMLPTAMAGSSTVHVTPDMTPGVVCVTPEGSFQLLQSINVTFTPLAKRTYGDSTEVPIQGKSLKHQLRQLVKTRAFAG